VTATAAPASAGARTASRETGRVRLTAPRRPPGTSTRSTPPPARPPRSGPG
jgi:hypothetical protein